MAGIISTRRVHHNIDCNKEDDSECSLSSVGDKLLDSSATNASSSSINNRRNKRSYSCSVNLYNSNLGQKIESNSVLSTLSAASVQQSNVISMLINSNRKFGYCSNQRCIVPSGQYENINGNCDNDEDNENNRRHVHPRIYDPHDIVSIEQEHSIPDIYNKITINDIILGDTRHKYTLLSYSYFVLLLGFMTHMVQAKDSIDIHTTAINVRINQNIIITE